MFDFWSPDLPEKFEQLEREELIRLRELEKKLAALELINAKYELTEEQKDKVRFLPNLVTFILIFNFFFLSLSGYFFLCLQFFS